MPANKKSNEYAAILGNKLYAKTPKAVFAAIALSPYFNADHNHASAAEALLYEWRALHESGVIPQKPPKGA